MKSEPRQQDTPRLTKSPPRHTHKSPSGAKSSWKRSSPPLIVKPGVCYNKSPLFDPAANLRPETLAHLISSKSPSQRIIRTRAKPMRARSECRNLSFQKSSQYSQFSKLKIEKSLRKNYTLKRQERNMKICEMLNFKNLALGNKRSKSITLCGRKGIKKLNFLVVKDPRYR